MMTADSKYTGLVSVVTAAHNAASHIERAVRSVARQSCAPLEHIVVDDGSTDQTLAILSEVAAEITNLRIVTQENRGAGAARNAGIEVAEGRYIAFLDSDDVWLEHKLERQISFMDKANVAFSYGNYSVVDGKSGAERGRYETPDVLTYGQLLRKCPIACSTVAYNQEKLGKRYMPEVRRGQDWALWLSLTRTGVRAVRYPGCDVVYYENRGSLSGNKLKKAVDMFNIYNVEEGIGRIWSTYYLIVHAINVLRKRPTK